MYALFLILFSLFSGQLYAQPFNDNIEKSAILRAMRVAAVADAPSQTPREDSLLLAAQSYGTEREKLEKEASIDEMKDSQTNVLDALFVEFKHDSNIVYLAFPGVRGISAEQGYALSDDVKGVLSPLFTSLDRNQGFGILHKELEEKVRAVHEGGKHLVSSGHCWGGTQAEKAFRAFGQQGDALLTFAPVIKPFDDKTQQGFTKQNLNVAMYNFTLEDDFWFGQPFKTLVKPLSDSTALGIPITLTAPSNDWWWNTHRAKRYISAVEKWLRTSEGHKSSNNT